MDDAHWAELAKKNGIKSSAQTGWEL